MKKLLSVFTLAFALTALTISPAVLTGCANLASGGAYSGNKVLYDADMVISTSYETVHSFVLWEFNNRAALSSAPQIKEFADSLRVQYPTWHKAAMAARNAYEGNPNSANKTALHQALTILRQAVTQAQTWIANSNVSPIQ